MTHNCHTESKSSLDSVQIQIVQQTIITQLAEGLYRAKQEGKEFRGKEGIRGIYGYTGGQK